jgi:hypothetical protein
MRRENLSLDDALQSLTPAPLDDFEDDQGIGESLEADTNLDLELLAEEKRQPEDYLQDEEI